MLVSLDEIAIKQGVDEMGIDKFIFHCATLAAGTVAASGFGVFTTMIVGVAADVINNIFQQYRCFGFSFFLNCYLA